MKRLLLSILAVALSWTALAQDYTPYLSQDEVRSSISLLPPPPAEGSIEFLMDKIAYWEYYKLRTDNPERAAQAVADAHLSDVGYKFEEAFGLLITPESMPETWLLLSRSRECFGSSGSNEAKEYYKRTRPFVYFNSDTLTPDDEGWMKYNYSYPSGHTANYFGLAYILSDLRPERTEALQKRAEQGGISRLIVGAHWASDVAAGKMVAASVYEYLRRNPEYQAQLKKARAEVQRELANAERPASGEYSPNMLIIMYDEAIGKTPLLKAVDKYKAEIVYDYRIIPGMAIRIPEGKSLQKAIDYFKKVEGVVSVEKDRIYHLTDPVKPRVEVM